MITWQDFEKIDIRCGTILSAEDFPNAKNPSFQLTMILASWELNDHPLK